MPPLRSGRHGQGLPSENAERDPSGCADLDRFDISAPIEPRLHGHALVLSISVFRTMLALGLRKLIRKSGAWWKRGR